MDVRNGNAPRRRRPGRREEGIEAARIAFLAVACELVAPLGASVQATETPAE